MPKRYIGLRAATSDSVREVTAAIWSNLNGPCTINVSTPNPLGKVFCGKMPWSAWCSMRYTTAMKLGT